MSKNPLWSLIQKHMDETRYHPKPADLARETGISEQVLSKWKAKPVLPSPILLLAFSAGTGVPYADLLRAALEGQNYLVDGTAKIEFSRGFHRAMQLDGPKLVEELKRRGAEAGTLKPIDLSDIFDVSAPTETLAAVANEGDFEEPGEDPI